MNFGTVASAAAAADELRQLKPDMDSQVQSTRGSRKFDCKENIQHKLWLR